jgi:hypothetical protein
MNCAEEEILAAKLDGELDEDQASTLEAHLAICSACRLRLEKLAQQREMVARAMSLLEPAASEASFDAKAAYARMMAHPNAQDPATPPAWQMAMANAARRRRGALWAAAAAALAFVVVFTGFEPARIWGQKVLEMLRVRQVTAVPVDSSLLPAPGNGNPTARMIQQLISDEVTVTQKPGKPRPVPGPAQASQLAGFPVRLFATQGSPSQLDVVGAAAANMVIQRDRLEAILQSAGRTDLQIPASVDGAMVAVYIPKSVVARYGNCPKPGSIGSRVQVGQAQGDFSSCVVLRESPSPIVSVPRNLNLEQLAEIGLQFTGMSAQQADDFCRTIDWTSTLVIPVPRDAGTYTEVDADGVRGVLMNGTERGRNGYTLIWVKKGIVYSILGLGDPAGATALADSLGG